MLTVPGLLTAEDVRRSVARRLGDGHGKARVKAEKEEIMTDRDRETREAAEAREALERVRRDTETLGSSALARMGRQAGEHFSAKDAVGSADGGGTDPVELWGRRIGRALSLIGVVILTIWLLVQLRIL
jgi:hypothetical protein